MSEPQATKENAPHNTVPISTQTITEYPADSVTTRRVQALREAYPTIPLPVALAMLQRASHGLLGIILGRLEDSLGELNALGDFDKLSGSQIRVLDVILSQIVVRISELRAELQLDSENH